MSFGELFLLAVGLSMDAFAVSVCKGLALRRVRPKHMGWVGLWFGGFQLLMPLLGYLLASTFARAMTGIAPYVAFILLAFIGINMIREAMEKSCERSDDDLSVKTMFLMAVATSIDAMAAGISMAMAGVTMRLTDISSIWVCVTLIGVTTCTLSAAGVKVGSVFGCKYEKKAEFVGGCILVLLGLKILLEGLGVL